MTEYERLVSRAYDMVEATNKEYLAGNHMAYMGLILGMGPYRLEDYEGNGHCFMAVDDAIHAFYMDNPESKADEGFIDGIGYALDRFPFPETFDAIVLYIKYELKKAKAKINTFEFNAMEELTDVKLFIAANYEKLKTNPDFMFWLEEERAYFKKNYDFTL